MCCLATIFLAFGSRLTILVWWLTDPQRFVSAFQNWIMPGGFFLPSWIWTVLGGLFLPWTTLAYLLLFQGGVVGYEWIVIAVAFLIDMTGHTGSYRHRNRIPSFNRRAI